MWADIVAWFVILLIVRPRNDVLAIIQEINANNSAEFCSAFECGPPRSERYLVGDLVDTQNEGYIFDNFQVVLHRCRASGGCCDKASKTCSVNESTNIRVRFSFRYHDNSNFTTKCVIVKNHTWCQCQEGGVSDERAKAEPRYAMQDNCEENS